MGVINELRKNIGPVVAVDAGGLAEKRIEADTADKIPLHLEILDKTNYVAVNLVGNDLPYFQNLTYRPEHLHIVSANVKNPEKLPIPVLPWVIHHEAGTKIGIMGLFLDEHEAFNNATSVLEIELPILRQQADVVVVLAYGTQDQVRELASLYPEIDIVVCNSYARTDRVTWISERQVLVAPALRGKSLVGIQFDTSEALSAASATSIDYTLGDELVDDASTAELIAKRSLELNQARNQKEMVEPERYLNLTPEEFMRQFEGDRL